MSTQIKAQVTMRIMLKKAVLTTMGVFLLLGAYAQKEKFNAQTKLDIKSRVLVDGNLSEWSDFGKYDYPSQGFHYQIAQDAEALYIGVRIEDEQKQMEALGLGFHISINPDNKKKPKSTLSFPLADRNSFREIMSEEDSKPENARIGALQAVRGIKIKGLEGLIDGLISLNNDFGIQAQATFDSNNALCIEYKIPLIAVGLMPTDAAESKKSRTSFRVNLKTGIDPEILVRQSEQVQTGNVGPYGNRPAFVQSKRPDPGIWLTFELQH